LAEFQASAAA